MDARCVVKRTDAATPADVGVESGSVPSAMAVRARLRAPPAAPGLDRSRSGKVKT